MEVIASLLLYFQVELAHLQRVTERVLCETCFNVLFFVLIVIYPLERSYLGEN